MAADAPWFTSEATLPDQSGRRALYYLREDREGARIDPLFAWAPAALEGLEDAVSLRASWEKAGVYLFLGERVGYEASFVEQLARWQRRWGKAGARLLWIANPTAAIGDWRVTQLCVTGATTTGGRVAARADLAFRNYHLVLERDCVLSLVEEPLGFRIAAPSRAELARAHVRVEGADERLPIHKNGVTFAVSGPDARCASFGLTLYAGPPIDVLDVGCRFFFASADGEDVDSMRFPLFDTPDEGIVLHARLDPFRPDDPARSRWAFAEDRPLIPSYFRTRFGGRIDLRSLPGSRLLFASRPDAGMAGGLERFYLVPDGPFEPVVAPEAAQVERNLLCGTAGAEYLELPEAGATLWFVAGRPAFAPGFSPGEPGDGSADTEASLTDRATTSWVRAAAADPMTYYAQPEGAVFFGVPPSAVPAPADAPAMLLPYFPVPAGRLPAAAPDGAEGLHGPFPLAPHAGLEDRDVPRALALEAGVTSLVRREIIHAATDWEGREASPNLLMAVNPRGLQGFFSEDKLYWGSLTLARMGTTRLAFEPVDDPLRAALLTDRQFIVLSDPEQVAPFFSEHNQIEVQGWGFHLDPQEWRRHGTIAVIKNRSQSFADLVEDTDTWVLADTFNEDPYSTRERLRAIIADARERHEAHASSGAADRLESDFAYFVETVLDDPGWNGVLFLSCVVPPAGLPPEFEMLAGGLDESRFYAHHLGIDQTPITQDRLEGHDSALFGLISYEDELRRGSTRYDFQVLSLKVRFRNSSILDFSSSVAVSLNELFGARAHTGLSATGNALVMGGFYQRRGDATAYVFRNEAETGFRLDDSPLERVLISRAELAAAPTPHAPEAAGEDEAIVSARFSFWGNLGFEEWRTRAGEEPFDLLSYDRLAFSNLGLEMSFAKSDPAARTFAFDASGLVFDEARSSARSASVAAHFPVSVSGVISSSAASKPGDLGYMTVSVPALELRSPGAEWFGLVFDLNLGTAGALAAKAGFTASLAIAWSPGGPGRRGMVGLRLPGSHGGNKLSLQGVLELSIYRTQLLGAAGAFLLKLTGMTFSFLGKALPTDGYFDFYLFGDPDGTPGSNALGWYGAYKKKQEKSGQKEDADERFGPSEPKWVSALPPPGEGGRSRTPHADEER